MPHGLCRACVLPAVVAVLRRLLPDGIASVAADVDEWFTTHYAGADWRSSGLKGTLPWKELPLSTVWAPLGGVVLYAIGKRRHSQCPGACVQRCTRTPLIACCRVQASLLRSGSCAIEPLWTAGNRCVRGRTRAAAPAPAARRHSRAHRMTRGA